VLEESEIRAFLASDYPRLVAGLGVVLGGRVAAEDAVQEALARAWERSMRGEQIESLRGWVAVVAMNLLRSRLRRLGVEFRATERIAARDQAGHPHADPTPGSSEERLDLAHALRALPRRQREALVLHYFGGLGIADIARALHTRPGAVKQLLHRGRRSLANALGPSYRQGALDA
jgi:RNA polymerase sigma-70 factor (ECF subfamily)